MGARDKWPGTGPPCLLGRQTGSGGFKPMQVSMEVLNCLATRGDFITTVRGGALPFPHVGHAAVIYKYWQGGGDFGG